MTKPTNGTKTQDIWKVEALAEWSRNLVSDLEYQVRYNRRVSRDIVGRSRIGSSAILSLPPSSSLPGSWLTVRRRSCGEDMALVAIGLASLGGTAIAQDSKTVIANAQKALGDPKSITYSGSAKDVAFQQCGSNAAEMMCRGTHDPMRPITNYVRVIDLAAPASRHTGATNNPGRRRHDADARHVLSAGHAATGGRHAAVEQLRRVLHHPVGLPERRGGEQRHRGRRRVDGKNYTVVTWSPAVKAASGKA